MNYYLDTEFYEDGRAIELISIGIVCEDGREFYRVVSRADETCKKSEWLVANVLPHLPPKSSPAWRARETIARDLSEFVLPSPREGSKPAFWGYYSSYDWVVLCQLFGTMMDLPKHFPRFCMDLKQLSVSVGSPKHPPQLEGEHDALCDARWNQELHAFLREQAVLREARERVPYTPDPFTSTEADKGPHGTGGPW